MPVSGSVLLSQEASDVSVQWQLARAPLLVKRMIWGGKERPLPDDDDDF